MESEVCPMDSLKTVFSPPCSSLTFVPKGLMTVKNILWTPLTMPLVLLVHPITLVPKGLL